MGCSLLLHFLKDYGFYLNMDNHLNFFSTWTPHFRRNALSPSCNFRFTIIKLAKVAATKSKVAARVWLLELNIKQC